MMLPRLFKNAEDTEGAKGQGLMCPTLLRASLADGTIATFTLTPDGLMLTIHENALNSGSVQVFKEPAPLIQPATAIPPTNEGQA